MNVVELHHAGPAPLAAAADFLKANQCSELCLCVLLVFAGGDGPSYCTLPV